VYPGNPSGGFNGGRDPLDLSADVFRGCDLSGCVSISMASGSCSGMIRTALVWIPFSIALAIGTWFLLGSTGSGPGGSPGITAGFRTGIFLVSVLLGLVFGWLAVRRRSSGIDGVPAWCVWSTFLSISLGVAALQPGFSPGFWGGWIALMAVGPVVAALLFRARTLLNGRAGEVLCMVCMAAFLLVYFFQLFPLDTWHHIVFTDDYSIVYFNTFCDLESYGAGGLLGWDHRVEGGRGLVLNLRTLAPLVAPFLFLGKAPAFHLMFLLTYLAFPVLVGLYLRTILKSKSAGAARAGLVWGFFSGSLFCLSYTTSLFRFGMIYSMAAVDLLLVQMVFLELVFRGKRWGAVGLGTAVALNVYVHLAQLAMGIGILIVILVARSPRLQWGATLRLLGGAALVAAGLAFPFLSALWIHRAYLSTRYLMGISPVLLAFQQAGPWETAWLLVTQALWEFPGYTRILALFLPLLGLAVFSRSARLGGLLMAGVLVMGCVFMVWIPAWGHSMLRLHFLIPVILAPVSAEVLRLSSGLGRGALFTGCVLVFVFFPNMDWGPEPLYSGTSLEAVEEELVRTVRSLPGHRVLFENAAGQSPLKDLSRPFDVNPGDEVQRAGPLALASGRDLFAHAGWDPYPYHTLRDAFIVNGAFLGDPLAEVDETRFEGVLKRYGVGGMVVWSRGARAFLKARPGRYEFLHEVAARADQVRVPSYAVFRYRLADARPVRMDAGKGTLFGRGPFGFGIEVEGAKEGGSIRIADRFLPGWTAETEEGAALDVVEMDGLLGVRAPRAGDYKVWFTYDRRSGDLIAGGLVAALGVILCLIRRSGRRRGET